MTSRSVAAFVVVAVAGCSRLDDVVANLSDFVEAGKLVDDTAFLPLDEGRRTQDSGGVTDVGTGITSIAITFIDELDPASVAGFSLEANLEFEGVAPHPSIPPFFNPEPFGRVRANQVLTIPLATPLPESTCQVLPCLSVLRVFHVRLVSRADGNPLRTIGVSTPYLGTFDIPFRVIARDGTRPFVSKLVTAAGTVEELTAAQVLAGPVEVGFLEPHSAVRIEFSEEMREGVPVLISPVVPIEETRTVGSREFRFFRPATPGLSFVESVLTPSEGSPYTVLTTPAGEVHGLGQEYTVRIPSDSTLALQTTVAQDLSGEALGANVPDARLAGIDFTAVLRFAHVVIDDPQPDSFVSGPMLDAGPVEVLGRVRTDFADGVTVTILDPAGEAYGPVAADPTGSFGQTPHGLLTASWAAQIPASAFEGNDGRYTIRADAGAFGSVDLYANDADGLDRVCIAVGDTRPLPADRRNDADRAELVLPDGSVLEAAAPEVFDDEDDQSRFGFCWSNVELGATLGVGRTYLTVRLYDIAGNVGNESLEIRVHPWINTVSPDQVPYGFFDKREITIDGVGFKTFSQALGDAVRLDERDLGVPVLKDLTLGSHTQFSLRLTVPENAPPGSLSVRIDGLESNRVRFEVCREEAAKYVTELYFDDRTPPVGFAGQLAFSMERGTSGEPVFVWTTTGAVARATGNGGTYAMSIDATGVANLDAGSPIQALRLPNGQVASVWLSRFRLHAAGLPGIGSLEITLPDPTVPVAIDAAVDLDGTPYALVTSTVGTSFPLTVVYLRLFRLDGTDSTGTLVGTFESNTITAFSGRLALGTGGTGWVLASGSETRAWYRRGSAWIAANDVFPNSIVADVSASRDGRRFAAALWEIEEGDPRDLGRSVSELSPVAGRLRVLSAKRLDTAWSEEWNEATVFGALSFHPPLASVPDGFDGRNTLAHAAAVRLDYENRPVVAYTDFRRRTLRYVHLGVRGPDVLDLDVTLGQHISLTLDGNDEGLVGYADLSHATTFESLEEDAKEGVRGTASIQLLDTRNRHAVVTGTTAASACSPGKFRVSSIADGDWSHIREHQTTRTKFTYRDLYDAFVGTIDPDNPPPEQQVSLRGKQASAAVFSRILRKGSIRFRGRDLEAGDTLGFTSSSESEVRDDELRGLRVPLGTTAVSAATFDTPDGMGSGEDRIGRFHIARFKPATRDDACTDQPAPRTDAAMGFWDGTLVLFGGRGEEPDTDDEDTDPNEIGEESDDGDFLFGATWSLSPEVSLPNSPCWVPLTLSTSLEARVGHTMVTAPSGRGVLLFGGRNKDGDALDDVWLLDPKVGIWTQLSSGPERRRQAAMAYDHVREQVWLFGGRRGDTFFNDLWVGTLGTTGDIVWTLAGSTMPDLPDERSDASLVFDEKGGQLILFGGRLDSAATPLSNDLWAYRIDPDPLLGEWHELKSNLFGFSDDSGIHVGRARGGPAVANVDDSSLVVFAGTTQGLGFRPVNVLQEPPRLIAGNSMDVLDLTPFQESMLPPSTEPAPWSFKLSARLPPAREHQAWAYDDASKQLFVFGGEALGVTLNDTLSFDLSQGIDDGFWEVLVPGDAEPLDALGEGRTEGGREVQWGRGDFLPLAGIPGLADALTALAPKEFPPIGAGAVRVTSFDLGPVGFDRLLELDPRAPDGQGVLESHLDFGTLSAEGRLETSLFSTTFSATTAIPTSTIDPGLGIPPVVILRPDLCDLFLDAGRLPEALVRRIPMEASIGVQPAVDSRGPTADDLDADGSLGLQSHSKLTGVTISHSQTLDVPLCIEVPNASEIELALLGPVLGHLAGIATSLSGRLIPAPPGQELEARGVLDDLAGAVVVDAFTNHGPEFGIDYEDRRTRTFQSISPDAGCPREDPEWVHMFAGGVSLGTRRQESGLLETCASF